MNFKQKLESVLEFLGFKQKFADKSLTQEEFSSIVAEYQKRYQTTLQDDLAAEDAAQKQHEQAEQFQQQLNSIYNAVNSIAKPVDESGHSEEQQPAINATAADVVNAINNLGTVFQTIAAKPADDVPAQVVNIAPMSVNGLGNTPEYLFGVEHPMFDMKKRWNIISANPRARNSMEDPDEQTDGHAFRVESANYCKGLKARFQYLQQNKMLDAKALSEGKFSNNYDGVTNAGVGNQFVVLRQDALIAHILQKRDLTQYFPVRYGIQDRDLLFNAYFDELSQAYQEGEVYKGGMKIENEMGYVDDAMIKMKFGPMKELERMYIAYLNKEGSDPIKWTMIEYCILNSLQQAQVEQNKRRMRGIYVKPEKGVAGSYLNSGTGIWYTLLRYVHDFSIKPHDDKSYRTYTSATFLEAVQQFVSDIRSSITEDMDIDNHVLYLNKNHQSWWIQNVRDKYHLDTDFNGPTGYLNVVPDTSTRIVWLPYEGQSTLMFMDVPGNIQFVEYIAGEMLGIKMEESMEMVRAWSTWKEGCGAAFTGRKFSTKEALDANGYEWQQIFMNLPTFTIADAIDAKNGFWQITGATTTATAITDIANAKLGVAYCIEIGDASKLVTIAQTGKFANITKAFAPKAVGDYILVILDSTGNYRELERREDGKRTINVEVQPNVPGGR
jgi:hypothetical protein